MMTKICNFWYVNVLFDSQEEFLFNNIHIATDFGVSIFENFYRYGLIKAHAKLSVQSRTISIQLLFYRCKCTYSHSQIANEMPIILTRNDWNYYGIVSTFIVVQIEV